MTTAAYDAIAAWYDRSIRQGSLLHEAAEASLFRLVPDVFCRLSSSVIT